MSDELDELTKDAETEEVIAEASTVDEVTETEEAADTGETGEEPEGEATPASRETPDGHVPIAALMDERDKRQALERRLAELEGQQQEAPEPPDPDEDPKGAYDFMQFQLAQARVEDRIALSREMMSMVKDDYADKEAAFMEAAEKDAALVRDMLASANPARFAYEWAQMQAEREAIKDVDAYKAKIRAEVEADVRAKLAEETKTEADRGEKVRAATSLPDLAGETEAKGGTATPTDEDLSEICLGHNT